MNLQGRQWPSFISPSLICVVEISTAEVTQTATYKRLHFA